jgi:tripartite-type tricarboxylate transporter receptor subunit TctC
MKLPRRRYLLPRRGFLPLIAGAAALPVASRFAAAQTYPARPIKLIAAFPAGGPADTMGRLIGQAMSSKIGQPVVIENIGGAGGSIALRMMATASPDGYTLLVNSVGLMCTASLLYKLNFEPAKALVAAGTFATDSSVIVSGPAVPAKTIAEFIHDAKANPGKFYSGGAIGTNQHMMAEVFKVRAGVNIPHIPYRGGAAAITDLLGGQIHMVLNNKSVLLQLALEGKLTPLVVTSTERWPELPNVPTMRESGIADVPTDIWYGIFAPPTTPAAIIGTINPAINDGMNSAEARKAAAKLGVELKLGTATQAATLLANDCPAWIASAQIAGIKVE